MTRRILEWSEYQALQNESLASVFRMEALDEYRIPGEDEVFQMFMRGETLPEEPEIEAWLERLRIDKTNGKIWRRVHIVSFPLSDYLRFEIETAYRRFAEAGEQISMLERNKSLALKIWNQDHWLFDDETLVLMRYDRDGTVLAREVVENEPDTLGTYALQMKQALDSAVPLEKFLDLHY